jgi:hypothetical protein
MTTNSSTTNESIQSGCPQLHITKYQQLGKDFISMKHHRKVSLSIMSWYTF